MQVENVKKYDRLKPLTLLYVEDSKFLSKVTVSGISTYFNKIYVAYNGQEGLDLLVSHGNEIDIVITDLDMPVMDGFEMIRRIRGGGCFMPIIVTTALNNYLERENLFELSIDAFLKKPVDTNKLIEKIDYVVDALFIRRELFTKKTMIHNDIIYCETDQNGCITYVSNPFEKISGYTREELLGQTHALLSSHETPQETYKEMWNNLVASKQWQGEFVNKRKDGTLYTVNIIVSPMYLRSKLGNRLVGYSATSLDITHYKAIAKELHIKSRQAAMGEMVAMIAHQWRQPITSIGMIANNLQFDLMMDELDTNVLKENLKTIDSHVKYLSNTINIFRNFLSESKKEEKVMLKSIIDAVLGVVHDICKENGIAIEVQQDCCAIEIRTLKDELIQALINIVTNAHEALLEQKVSQPKISIECAQDQDSITIIITDNAGGIPEVLLTKIFTPYFSTKQEKNGTGLGLYMTKTIIEENLEGTLSVSNDKEGALFVIKLPKKEIAMNQEQINKLRKVCKNISVLYVEDDKNISIQVERLLKKIFLDVEVEKNGFLGLANFTQNRQDIVITDISMPVMDGIEMAKEIKNLNSEQNILVTSAHNDVEYLIELIEIGIDRFVAKPIDINSFFVNISKIAVGIYREKREALMEYRLKMQQDLQKKILGSVAFPMVYFEGDKVVYANSNFRKHFYTEIDANDADRFRLGYLFDEKKFVTMSNATVLDEIEAATNKIYLIMDVGEKIVKKYNINISNLQEKNHRLVGFINLDDINVECERFRTQVDYFPKREAFLRATLVQRNRSEENYLVFCVGLKNTKRFIDRYGGVKMHTIYTELARYLKREFEEEIESRMLFVFLFETNRYIFLADKKIGKAVEKKLEAFGKKYSYEYGSRLALELNYLKEEIAHATPTTDVSENTEGMLYTFDD